MMKLKKSTKKKLIKFSIGFVIFIAVSFFALNTEDAKRLLKGLNIDDTMLNYAKNNNNTTDSNIENTIDDEIFEEAYVKRVVDGDTIIAVINDKEYRVRFIGMNTPESTTKIEEYGKEASEYTKLMLTGKNIYLQKDVSETDKYNRLLRYVWLEKPTEITEDSIREKMFNANLVLNGYANSATYPPDVKYSKLFIKFEKEAREKNLGLWGI